MTIAQQELPAVGRSGLSKDQLVEYFRRKLESQSSRPDVSTLLYDAEDKSQISELHAQMILPMVGLDVYEAAMDPGRKEPLIAVWKRAYLKYMISFERKGRLEYLGALQALAMEEPSSERSTRL